MTLNKIYEPGEDSYLLQKYVDQYSKVDSVLDMGTGTGIQGLTASKYATNVLSVDVNPEAVKQTKTLIEIEKKKNIKILESDLFSKIPKQKFDLIIFNPPYLPKHKHVDNIALVSGKRGVDTTLKFMDNVNEYLTTNGKILLITSSLASQSLLDESIKTNLLEKKELEKIHVFFEDIILYELTKNELLKKIENMNIANSRVFAHGKRGLIIKAKKDKTVISIKTKKPGSKAFGNLEIEANTIQKLNKYNIGPKLISYENDMLIYEFVNGYFIEEYIKNNSKSNINIVIDKLFDQIFQMDKLGINKFEMHHPIKHILIENNNPVQIDFERARHTDQPKNVTQFCDFLISKDMTKLLANKKIKFDSDELINAAKDYKKDYNKKKLKKIKEIIFSSS
jgi:HemK-related putative methylase